jgi:hypothetical protein
MASDSAINLGTDRPWRCIVTDVETCIHLQVLSYSLGPSEDKSQRSIAVEEHGLSSLSYSSFAIFLVHISDPVFSLWL